MNTKKIEIKTSLTSRVFRFMVLSFFISNIMTVLGSVIDGFVVGNTMDENTIAAVGFVSPVVILFSIIGATACVGFKNVATRYLSKGDTEGAGRAFGEALVIALSLSVIVMILTLMFTPTVVAGLGIHKTSGEYLPCVRYLRGTALGLPAITAMAILSNGVQIEGRRIIAVLSVAVMAVSNILIDVIGVNLLHFNVFGITIGTSVSYYAGTAILVYYYCHENVLIRPTLKEATFKEALLVNKAGLAAGVINTFYSLTLIVKAGLINDALSLYAVESIGLQAYNVIIQVNYFVTAFMSSAVAVMFLLATMFSAEEDKDGFKKVMKSVVAYEIITTAVFSILLWIFARLVAWLYLGNVGDVVLGATAAALRAYTVGIMFQMIILVFANYIQNFKHVVIPIILFFISNVVAVLYGEGFGIGVVGETSLNYTAGIFGGISVANILTVLIFLPIFIAYINKRNGCKDHFWMFPKAFGVPESDEISAVIGNLNDVIEFSDRTLEFCEAKGHSPKLTFYTALSVEEMAKNVVEHGFTKDKKENFLSARVVDKGDELIIRMRDDCPRFDPREKYEQIYANEDLGRMMGIRMIMTEAKEVKYTSMFRLNNLLIRIGTKETKKKDPKKKADEESAE